MDAPARQHVRLTHFASKTDRNCGLENYSPPTVELLARFRRGDAGAEEELFQLLYDDLRQRAGAIMARERHDHTLQPTALVNEAYFKLVDQTRVQWQDRTHFMAIAARVMRRILTDHARRRLQIKRGGDRQKVKLIDEPIKTPDEHATQILSVDRALERLQEIDRERADIVMLRIFGGLSMEEIATALGIPLRTVERRWTGAKAWLRTQMIDAEE